MRSRDLNTLSAREADARYLARSGRILVEIRKTHSMRDVRDAFLALAYLLHLEPARSLAVCVLVESRLSQGRLQEELERFRAVIHTALADRIHFLVKKGAASGEASAFHGSLKDAPEAFLKWLDDRVAHEQPRGHVPQLPPRHAVLATLAHLRVGNQPPVTVKHLQLICGVSYPTAAAMLKALEAKGWLEESDERGVRLRPLTAGEWLELARDHAKVRQAHFFTDPTGQGSPEQMVKRLARLQAVHQLPPSVRLGGVIGAAGHFPALDITAAPRLDLSVDADPAGVAEMLDAALVPKSHPEQRIALAVHVTLDRSAAADAAAESTPPWAGPLECLADLIEMGFTREAAELAHHMELTNRDGGPA
jgi:DNA-binding MarR family transcriptional regulator